MFLHPSLRVIEASDASQRLSEARAWVAARADGPGVLIVSASRGAADDLARAVALARGGAIGLHRFSIAQLAARLAAPVLAARGIAPVSFIGGEAVAARATFEASRSGGLDYFGPVARTPGFPRALARTLHELMLARVDAAALASLPLGGADLARLLERFEDQFAAASATDRGALFEAAAEAAAAYREFPLLLLDVPLDSAVEFDFATKLIAAAPDVLVTIPFGDLATLDRFKILGLEPVVLEPGGTSDLTALKRYVFATRQPPERRALGDVRIFSAPGEGRECVEIARRILDEARSGVPFDEMAVFVRSTARLRRPARSCVLACRDSRLVRSRDGTPAPVGPGISGPSRMRRGAAVCGTVRGIPLPLTGPRGLAGGRVRDPAARRRSVLRIHGHRIAAGRARSGCRGGSQDRTCVLTVRSVGTSDPCRPERGVPVRSGWHSSRALEMGNAHRRIRGDWRRSSAVASPARRPRRGVSAEGAGRGSRGSRLAAAPAPRAGRAQPRTPSRLCAAGDRRPRGVAFISDVGRLAHAVRGARAAVFSENPRACCASSQSCGP